MTIVYVILWIYTYVSPVLLYAYGVITEMQVEILKEAKNIEGKELEEGKEEKQA